MLPGRSGSLTCVSIYWIVVADSRDDDLGEPTGELTGELDARDAPTKGPFLAALAVVVLVIGVILIVQWVRPFDGRVSDDDAIRMAVNDHYTALNALNYETLKMSTCAAKVPPLETFLETNRKLRDANGMRIIPAGKIADISINGDHATTNVTWHYEKNAAAVTTTPTTLIRQDERWKVC